ncbi:MICOS complex subunit Mic60 isoform X1 [Diorhabda carinulata]|uniref:MICOS complex subunit Mic60 isoform X1 n=1 Tax=Diorhabda carinulata TaxID=1163345 RepID=UPI0025A1E86F|nr:MICOS complex subunit Mic60 isoform X1 [Diorhabda carinulata]XP_057664525.1 MICOS complex subunit Mic60 isoform X1 [Diorhabda carinulata]
MLRFIKRIPHKKIWQKRNVPVAYRSPNFHIISTPKRNYSQSTKEDAKSGRGGKFLLAVGAIITAGGATLAYAKYDPDFRKTLTGIVPFTDDVIRVIWQEDNLYSSNLIAAYYDSIKKSVLGLFSGSKSSGDRMTKSLPEPTEYKAPPPIIPVLEKEVKKPPPQNYTEIRLEKLESGKQEPVIELAGDPKPKAVPTSSDKPTTENIAKLEEEICESAEEAVNAFNKAVFITKSYNADIEYIIDEAVNEINPETWEIIKGKTRSKQECVRRAKEKADIAVKKINKLKELVSSPSFEADQSTKQIIQTNIAKVQEDIENAKKELSREQKIGSVAEKYWDKVEKSRIHFSEELESLFPTIDLSKKQLCLTQEDLDLFVLHTYAHVLFYQKELAKMETLIQERLRAATEAAKKGGGEVLTNAQICEALEQEKRRLNLCFQQQVLKLRKQHELELREQLKRQSQTFTDHLEEAVKRRAEEIELELTRKYDELLENEKCKAKIQLAAVVGRLKGLDQAITEKNNADAASRQAQVLWSACQALLRAIKAGCPGLSWKDQIRPLEPEISAVEKAAAENDDLVCAVINGIPKEARERGVYPEDALRERFLKVEKVARTVALVPDEGAALPVHILSYIQSLLLIKAASPIPQSELNDEKIDISKLNTNDILQRARYWLDRGDFAQTLKYMNLLKGAPRCVAREWMEETRIYLETQQAANTLMAYAASSGLTYL